MKGFRDRNPYVVGAVSVLAIGAVVAMAFLAGILHLFEDTYRVRGEFQDAAGIARGDAVRVAGIKSGRVALIRAERRRGLVLVDFEVDRSVHLGPGTHAEIALETLLGRKYIRLTGPVVGPYLADEPTTRRIIPVERTKTPFDLFELVKVGTRQIDATDTDKLNHLVKDLAVVTADKQQQVRQLLDGLTRVSSAVNERDGQVRQLLDRLDSVSKTLSDKDQTLVSLVDESQRVLELVSRRRDDIGGALRSGNELVSQLSGIVGADKRNIDAILDTLHPTIEILDKRRADIDRGLAWAGVGAYGLAISTAHGPWQDIFVRSVGPDANGVLAQMLGNRP